MMTPLSAGWSRLAPRERTLVLAAATLVGLALFWWVLVGPALSTLRSADAQQAAADAQLQRMRGLQAQAESLKAQPRQNPEESLRLLEAAVRERLGSSARMSVAADRVTLTLAGTPADALAQWLTQARVNARALPTEARLARNAAGAWDGTLVLALPPR